MGISTDSVKSHKKFQDKYLIPFPLIADEEKKIVEQYSVWGEKNLWEKPIWALTGLLF
ncbi:MAG: redoxin domain-containing protein [Segetibacter sp.]